MNTIAENKTKNVSNSTSADGVWNASLYDDKHSFVFKYGEDLVHLLNPKPGERILDLGCGTGYLTNLIAGSGAKVIGIDNSVEMIEKAKAEYPEIDFEILSATDFHFAKKFDAVFSNAVMHWVLEKESAIDCMYENLKPNGRLVIEMGGKNNVQSIMNAIEKYLPKYAAINESSLKIWYYPSLSEYTSLLEAKGFRVTYASHYDRETELKDTANGIKDWIKMFGSSFLKNMNETVADKMLNEIQESLRPTNFREGKWFADYKRLRIVAIKQD
ncbi:MAG TPA: methyltransferase domain-containing protein [Puia sp.]|nr:methyltransferase domain-containing protein [Puia sp.]